MSDIPAFYLDAIGWSGNIMLVSLHMLLIRGTIRLSSKVYVTNLLIAIGMILAPVLMRATLSSGLLLITGFVMVAYGTYQWWKSSL